jgi:hypothetical protein
MARNNEEQWHVEQIDNVENNRWPSYVRREEARRIEAKETVTENDEDDSEAFGDVERFIATARGAGCLAT